MPSLASRRSLTFLCRALGAALLAALAACGGGWNDGAPATPSQPATPGTYTAPGDTTAGDTTAGDTTAGDTTSGDTTSGDTTSGDTTAPAIAAAMPADGATGAEPADAITLRFSEPLLAASVNG